MTRARVYWESRPDDPSGPPLVDITNIVQIDLAISMGNIFAEAIPLVDEWPVQPGDIITVKLGMLVELDYIVGMNGQLKRMVA